MLPVIAAAATFAALAFCAWYAIAHAADIEHWVGQQRDRLAPTGRHHIARNPHGYRPDVERHRRAMALKSPATALPVMAEA